METLHIALIATNTYPSPPGPWPNVRYGGEVSTFHLAESLDDLGHEVDLYAPPGSWKPPRGDLFFMRCSYGSSTPWFWESEQEIYDKYLARILAADVVHDFSHTKRVAENLTNFDQRYNLVSSLWGSTWQHPQPPVNVVVWSEAMRQMGKKGWGGYEGSNSIHMSKVNVGVLPESRVVWGGTDTDWYAPGPGPEGEDPYIIWFSRFHPSKGFQIAIDMAKQMGFRLVMMGPLPEKALSPDHAHYAQVARQMAGDAPNIKFVDGEGPAEMKRAYIRGARAFLFPLDYQECFGLVMIEAMACGTPVLTLNRGATPEVVEDGKTGYVCNDVQELARRVYDIDKLDRAYTRERTVREFSRQRFAKRYLELYKDVMAGVRWGI